MIFDWIWNRRVNEVPEFWDTYLKRMEESCSRKTPIHQVRFVIIDTETTGLDWKSDRILSIGAVGVNNWQIDLNDSLECMVDQQYQPDGKAVQIHGILPVDRRESLSESEAVKKLVSFVGNAILVGHHIGFDIRMINEVLKKHYHKKLRNICIDTSHLAARLNPPGAYGIRQAGKFGLDSLCEKYNIPKSDRHTAAGDAFITAILFMKLLARLRVRGIRTIGDLVRRPVR